MSSRRLLRRRHVHRLGPWVARKRQPPAAAKSKESYDPQTCGHGNVSCPKPFGRAGLLCDNSNPRVHHPGLLKHFLGRRLPVQTSMETPASPPEEKLLDYLPILVRSPGSESLCPDESNCRSDMGSRNQRSVGSWPSTNPSNFLTRKVALRISSIHQIFVLGGS